MNTTVATVTSWAREAAAVAVAYFSQPFALYQVAVLLAALVAAPLIARSIEPRLEANARRIRANAGVLRLIVALLHRTKWVVLIVLLWLARIVFMAITWPSRSYLLHVALVLATAWLVIGVLTRIIRNRTAARTVALLIWAYVALKVLGIDGPVFSALDTMAIDIGTVHLSAYFVLKTAIFTTVLFACAIFVSNFAENRLSRSKDLSPSFQVLLGKIVKISLIAVAFAVALSATGIDLTALTVFSGAVGVGIGFGLQTVVSNFISGVIILLDKSIKPGDTIELADTFGWIRELRARFVSVITRDGREYLIPNQDFIAERVVNWSFSSDFVRLDVDFGVDYSSDPHAVTRIAIEAAKTVPRVLDDRNPVCWLTGFGGSSLDFKLRFWICDPQAGLTNVRGQVLLALWDGLKAAGVKIPYPHREIIMQTPSGPDDTA